VGRDCGGVGDRLSGKADCKAIGERLATLVSREASLERVESYGLVRFFAFWFKSFVCDCERDNDVCRSDKSTLTPIDSQSMSKPAGLASPDRCTFPVVLWSSVIIMGLDVPIPTMRPA